eukprot:3731950-Rhodomonas_salina.1
MVLGIACGLGRDEHQTLFLPHLCERRDSLRGNRIPGARPERRSDSWPYDRPSEDRNPWPETMTSGVDGLVALLHAARAS